MQYWVHISGVQRGPMQLEELIGLGITAETYVWREGLAAWVQAREVPELAGFFILSTDNNTAPDENRQQVENDFVVGETVNDNETDGKTDNDNSTGQQQIQTQQPQMPQMVCNQQHPMPACPPTNLAWAIIITVLCCQVFGIIAIIYAAQVKSKYDMGQYEKAIKYSENAALWCKLGIAFGLVWITVYSTIIPFLEIMSL